MPAILVTLVVFVLLSMGRGLPERVSVEVDETGKALIEMSRQHPPVFLTESPLDISIEKAPPFKGELPSL